MDVVAYTVRSPDGVIGLNGRFYLEDDDGERMLFKNIEDAKDFIADGGEDPEDEFIGYVEIDGKDIEHDLYHDGTRIEE